MVDGRAPIPLLEDLLGAWPDLRVNIDCKSNAAVDALVATLRRTGALGRVCIGAFNDLRLLRIRRLLGDDVCTTLGPLGVAALTLGLRRPLTAHAAQVPVRQGPLLVVDRRFVDRAHELGIHVHVWTIDDPDEMHRLLDLGHSRRYAAALMQIGAAILAFSTVALAFVPAIYVVAVCVLALGLLGYAVSQHPSQHPKETHVG